MPQWMALLTIWVNDSTRSDPAVVRRYASLAHRFPKFSSRDWRLAEHRALAAILRLARADEADEWGCHAALDAMIALHERSAAGELVTDAEFAAATEWAAWGAATATTVEAAGAARAAQAAGEARVVWETRTERVARVARVARESAQVAVAVEVANAILGALDRAAL